MVDIDTMIGKISKNIGCTEDALRSRMESFLAEQRNTWLDSGLSEEDCNIKALRMVGRQIKSENDRLSRSGATVYEGMFLSVPRYKDWAELAYKKMATQIANAPEEVIDGLVEQGIVTLYEDNNDGTFTKKYNGYLARGEDFDTDVSSTEIAALPKNTYEATDGIHFHLVWDKVSPTFPSGDKNFKYGNARPLSEKDRSCMFLGRANGGEVGLHTFRFSGTLAEEQFPTFVAGRIAMRSGRGDVAWGKAGVSTFYRDDSIQQIFSDAPDTIIQSVDGIEFLSEGLQQIRSYVETLDDKTRWDALASALTEVVHIDPRDNGGYIVTVGDLDIMSTAGTVDIYVPASHEQYVDFSVGSTLLVVGQPYISRDDEARLSITGWWCAESMALSSPQTDDGGWD